MDRPSGRAFVINAISCPVGRRLCEKLARDGYDIAFTHNSDETAAEDLKSRLEAVGATVLSFRLSGYSAPELSSAVVGTAEKFGGADMLLFLTCYDRGDDSEAKLLLDLDEEDWDRALDRGAKAYFLSCKYILPYLIAKPGSRVVVIDTIDRDAADSSLTEYTSSRALDAAVGHIALELSYYGISALYRRIAADSAPGEIDSLIDETEI